MNDEITLTIPRDRDYHRVAHLVLSGLALRLDLTIETLEDLQIALGAILDRAQPDGDVTVSLSTRAGILMRSGRCTTATRVASTSSSSAAPATPTRASTSRPRRSPGRGSRGTRSETSRAEARGRGSSRSPGGSS